jgi:glycosyltransferase EpsD
MKHALIVSTVSGFLLKFEKENVKLLQRMGYQVHYAANMNEPFYTFQSEELAELGVQAHHIDVARSPYMIHWNARALIQLTKIVREYSVSLIHCHEPMGGVLGRMVTLMAPRQRIRVAYTAHGFHFYRGAPLINNTLYYTAEWFLAHLTDELILVNQEDYDAGKRLHLRPEGGVWKIPGVGLDHRFYGIPTRSERNNYRKKHGIAPDQFILISVGELNENKNHQVILRAIKELKDRSALPEGFLYGICGDGFLREQLQEIIRQEDLTDTVQLYGYCTDVREYLAMADATAFPSIREGLGMAALESLAMGIPVLAANNRGTKEYMRHGINGFVCSWDDVSGFADALLQLFRMDHKERKEIAAQAVKSAEPFSHTHTTAVMEKVYQKIDAKVEALCTGRKLV